MTRTTKPCGNCGKTSNTKPTATTQYMARIVYKREGKANLIADTLEETFQQHTIEPHQELNTNNMI